MGGDRTVSSCAKAAGATARGRSARYRRCDFINCPHRLPVAISAQGFSAILHGAAVFPPLARRRDVGGHQPRAGDAGARKGRARSYKRSYSEYRWQSAKYGETKAPPKAPSVWRKLWNRTCSHRRSQFCSEIAPRGLRRRELRMSHPRPNATRQSPKMQKRDQGRAEPLRFAGARIHHSETARLRWPRKREEVRTRDFTDIGFPALTYQARHAL